jgi:ATP synthase protein I
MTEGDPDPSFEERLRKARDRQGLDRPATSNVPGTPSPWGIGVRVGVELVSALVIAVGIGLLLDHWLGTRPIFLALFVLLGGAAGVLNVYRLFMPVRQDPDGKRRWK